MNLMTSHKKLAKRSEVDFILCGGEIEVDGKKQFTPGLIQYNKMTMEAMNSLNVAIVTIARLLGKEPEQFDKEMRNVEENKKFMEKLNSLAQANPKP